MSAYIDIESGQFGTATLSDGSVIQFKMPSTLGKTDAGQIEAYRNALNRMSGGWHDAFAPAPKGMEWVDLPDSHVRDKPYAEWLVIPKMNWQLQPKRRYVR